MQRVINPRLIPVLIAAAFSGTAAASGFQLTEQNAAGVGTAFAGAAASAEDASTIFFNPAGMTLLSEGHNLSVAATALDRRTYFTDEGTSGLLGKSGDNGGNGGGTHVIPALYYSYALTPDWRLGLGVSPTFADETEYDSNFIGRYSGLKTSIRVINVNPSIAYKFNDQWSFGFGVDFARANVEFQQQANASTVGILKGDAYGWGYNFGVNYQITPATRLGLSYRSTIKFNLEGTQNVPGVVSRDISATLEMPDTASLALNHKLNNQWTILGDFTWTGWSSLTTLSPMVGSTATRATAPLRYNFKDTYRVGLGATYDLNNAWKLRVGTAYDKNPIPDDASRTMTVPDADRIWLALGARWTLSPKTSIDFGYAHVFVKDSHTARVVYANTGETVAAQTVRGKFENRADMLSVQANFAF